jgi:hypothetical protein
MTTYGAMESAIRDQDVAFTEISQIKTTLIKCKNLFKLRQPIWRKDIKLWILFWYDFISPFGEMITIILVLQIFYANQAPIKIVL